MTSAYIEPLNFKYIFINTFAGNIDVFTGILFIAICIGAGMFRMSNQVFLLMIVLAAVLLQSWIGQGIYLLVILVAGLASFWATSRIVKN